MSELAQKACWPLGVLAAYAFLHDVWVVGITYAESVCAFGSNCLIILGVVALPLTAIFAPWYGVRWLIETWLGIEQLTFLGFTLPIILVFVACYATAYPKAFMDRVTNIASLAVIRKGPKPKIRKVKQDNEWLKGEIKRTNSHKELEEALVEMEIEKAKIDGLKRKD